MRPTAPLSPHLLPFTVLLFLASTGCSPKSTTPPEPSTDASPPAATEAPTAEAPTPEPDPPAAEVTLLGEWVGDTSCVPQMAGMENADEATIETVGTQIAANRFTFTETTLTHEFGTAKAEEPYEVLAHEGSTWTIEMKGPTGQPQRTGVEVTDTTMRMTRDGTLVICLRRP